MIVQLGDNGPAWYTDLLRVRHVLRGVQHVVVVNVRIDRSWEQQTNSALAQFVGSWHQATLADWYGSSRDSWLQDGVHPWPDECPSYAKVIATALRRPA